MPRRQAASDTDAVPAPGREAQRRRTRAALVQATSRLLADGRTPSVDEIAAAAQVSRRTVYMHFPTLDQLLLDATVGAMSENGVDAAFDAAGRGDDATSRVDALVQAVADLAPTALPLGRKLIRLTVDAPPTEPGQGRRGYRRVAWVERAVEPLRDRLTPEQHARLVSALCVMVGWESMVVLRDVRGLDAEDELHVTRWAAQALVRAMLDEATATPAQSTSRPRRTRSR